MPQNTLNQLKDLAQWKHQYPTKIQLALKTGPKTTPGKTINPDCLPFNADTWLDDPKNGANGAKTWQAIESELAAWAKTLLDITATDPIQTLIIHYEKVINHPDYESFAQDIHTIWAKTSNLLGYTDQPGPSCLKCETTMLKQFSTRGWDGLYYCPACNSLVSPETYALEARARLRRSSIPQPTHTITWLFPQISSGLLRTWKHRRKISPTGRTKDGELLWDPSKIEQLVQLERKNKTAL